MAISRVKVKFFNKRQNMNVYSDKIGRQIFLTGYFKNIQGEVHEQNRKKTNIRFHKSLI